MNQEERKNFMSIINEDLDAIQSKIREQIKILWAEARLEILKKKGWDKFLQRKKEIEKIMCDLREELHQIERSIQKENLTVRQALEYGGRINDYGGCRGANFFGISIESQFDFEVAELIKENVNLEVPAKFLHDLARSSIRELTMAGTFEHAQKIYEKFYSLDFKKYGVDIPPRLDDMKKTNPLLIKEDKTKK